MSIEAILVTIDAEIAALKAARAALIGDPVKRSPGRPPGTGHKQQAVAGTKKKRNLTPEGRRRIAEAVKRRWALQKKTQKAA